MARSRGDANQKASEITPAYCCYCYLGSLISLVVICLLAIGFSSLDGNKSCYLELFAHTVSVSNSNVSTADWSIGFVATSPVTGCKLSLYTINSRLLRGKEIISESSHSSDIFGQFAASYKPDWTIINIGFSKVVTPEVIGDVVWNVRVEILARMNTDVKYGNGESISALRKAEYVHEFFMVVCRDIPVRFTADPAGNMVGSLLGNMRRCDYTTVYNPDTSNFRNYP